MAPGNWRNCDCCDMPMPILFDIVKLIPFNFPQKITKNEKVRAKAHAKKKKPTKTKDKETRTDETNEDGEEESEIAEQQVVAAAAADGPRAVPVAAAAGPQAGMMPFPVTASWMPQMPHQYNPSPYLYSGFNPFHNFNDNR